MRANTLISPSDAQCPGIGEAHWPARDRIVSQAMMGGGAFVLLKTGRYRPESAGQAEIRLAILLKILSIGCSRRGARPGRQRRISACDGCLGPNSAMYG
jgi:hypothetical protein